MSSPIKYLAGAQERGLILVLAAIQFTHITDFVIMMPLGPQFMRVFQINAAEFGALVSAYTFSAAGASLLAAWFLDRWDRKKALISMYTGFLVGTALCGLSDGYIQLLLARGVAGAFGGSVTAVSFAIIGDLIHPSRRGRATGMLMASFSVATVLGLPLGLWIAAHLGWHWVFLAIAFAGSALAVFASYAVPSVKPAKALGTRWGEISNILSNKQCQRGLIFVGSVMSASFVVIPFLSPSLVLNSGVAETDLSLIYLVGGVCTFFSAQFIGRACDRYGHKKIFFTVASISTIPLVAVTYLPPIPLPYVLVVTTLFMMFVSGRMVPTMAMLTGLVDSSQRGSFLSLITFVQQLFMGMASYVGGLIVETGPSGRLLHYPRSGYLGVCLTVMALYLARGINTNQQNASQGDLEIAAG